MTAVEQNLCAESSHEQKGSVFRLLALVPVKNDISRQSGAVT